MHSIPTKDSKSRYSALRTVGTMYRVLGWITLVGGILLGIVLAGAASSRYSSGSGILVFLGMSVLGATVALPMFAARDIVTLAIDLVSNARKTTALLANISMNSEPLSKHSEARERPSEGGSPTRSRGPMQSSPTPAIPSTPIDKQTDSGEERQATLTQANLNQFLSDLGYQLESTGSKWTVSHPGGIRRHAHSTDKLRDLVEEIATEHDIAVNWKD